jgi:4-hydroxy-tetrahydrodipicolinate synthase
MHKFAGTGVALVTPFLTDRSVDYDSLTKIVTHVIGNGADYLVVLGTTSEAPVLKSAEKFQVINTIKLTAANRVPVVLGIGGNDTATVINQIESTDFEGVSGILSVVPYYNKPQPSGLYQHFETIANASPVPVILYNVPGRTSVNMKSETTLKLAHNFPVIQAIKEASGDFSQIMAIINDKPEGFEVLSGDDALTLPMMAAGAKGVISVMANALIMEFTSMVKAMLNNDLESARMMHYKLLPMMEALFADGNPAGIKSLMARMGLCSNVLRLPLASVNENTEHLIQKIYTGFIQKQ